MKLSLIAALALLSTPACAWVNTNNGHNNQIVDGGPGAQANATASAKGGRGGAGGASSALGGSSTATGGNVAISGLAGGRSGRAPDIGIPSIGGGGMDCPTVGFGAGGSGLGGGGGIGPSWISSDCNKRKVASLLATLYGDDVARAYVEANIAGVKEAVAAADKPRPAYAYPAWCRDRSGVWLSDLDECVGGR